MCKQWERGGWTEILLILVKQRETVLFPHYGAPIRSALRAWLIWNHSVLLEIVRQQRRTECLYLMQISGVSIKNGYVNNVRLMWSASVSLCMCVWVVFVKMRYCNLKNWTKYMAHIVSLIQSWLFILFYFTLYSRFNSWIGNRTILPASQLNTSKHNISTLQLPHSWCFALYNLLTQSSYHIPGTKKLLSSSTFFQSVKFRAGHWICLMKLQ